MFEDTFDQLEKTFASMRAEMRKVFTRAGIKMTNGITTVLISRDSDIKIDGQIRSLTINGKLVRFKEK